MHIDFTLPFTFRDGGAIFQERLNQGTRQIPRLAISKLRDSSIETRRRLSEDDRGETVKTRCWLEHLEVFLVDVMERTYDLADGSRVRRWKAVVHCGMTSKKQKNWHSSRREEVEKHGSYHDTSRRGCARYARAQPTRVCTHDTVKLPRQKQLRYSPTVRVTQPWDNENNQTTTMPASRHRCWRNTSRSFTISDFRMTSCRHDRGLTRIIVRSRFLHFPP